MKITGYNIRYVRLTLVLCCLALALAGCMQPPANVGGPASTPAPTAVPVDEAQWHVLSRRPGWSGGAAVDLRAVGDIMLGRYVAQVAQRQGLDYPLRRARPLLAGDLTIGNLESPLTGRTELRPGPYRLPADPAFAAPLKDAGFDVLALANNHALDAGPQGLRDAVTTLSDSGITPLGAGPDSGTARAPAIVTRGGLRIALLAFNDVADPQDAVDEGRGWGRAWLDDAPLDAVRRVRADADLVIVLIHWGQEYAAQPSERQREWAGRLVGAGADLVVGAHPHVLQPVETLTAEGRSGLVAYSLGNFIFDQPDSVATSTGAVLRVLLDRQGVALAAVAPVEIVAGQARPLALESAAAQAALQALSTSRGTIYGAPTTDPTASSSASPSATWAWSWDGAGASPVAVPPDTQLVERPERLAVDLRGDGQPLHATLDERGLVEVRDGADEGAPLVWQNEANAWRVTRIDSGDPNRDGRIELVLLLWKPDAHGVLRSHPFLMGWRGGYYRIIWGGSATATSIQDLAVGDLNGDGRQELVVLEGGHAPGDPAELVSVWDWHSWGFELEWREALAERAGTTRLALQDLNGDGKPEIVVSSET